jgi:mono/diheme cytochrome c family protein
MRNKFNHILFFAVLFIALLTSSCQQSDNNTTGSEFMPDMAHSIAYEANTYAYYYNNTWGTKDEYYNFAQPGEPVKGTVARGAAGISGSASDMDRMMSFEGELTNAGISIPVNGSVPYPYVDTEESRLQAAADIIQNPFPIQDAKMKEAKELYNIYCGICHGEKGDGAGYLVREDGGKYPAQPANLLLDNYIDLSNGQYYHAIMYGKNVMGGYSDKLSYEERWQVIHYIRTLQAKEKKLAYNEEENTLDTMMDIALMMDTDRMVIMDMMITTDINLTSE